MKLPISVWTKNLGIPVDASEQLGFSRPTVLYLMRLRDRANSGRVSWKRSSKIASAR